MEILGVAAGMVLVALAAYRLGKGRKPKTPPPHRMIKPDRYQAILRNINRYDGSSTGQEVIR